MGAFTRREAMGMMAAGSAAALLKGGTGLLGAAGGQIAPMPGPMPPRAVVPLPFAPGSLKGLSERLITSHHDHNYAGAVVNLNAVRARIAELPKGAPGYLVGALRAKELAYANSAALHEAYFANLGGDGKADGPAAKGLASVFGSAAAWEEAFRALGSSLGGGSGWVVLDYAFLDGSLRIAGSGDHTQALAGGYPLLVMDMYEHAYQMDYGAAADRYIDAFFQNIRWDEVDRRFEAARRAFAPMRA